MAEAKLVKDQAIEGERLIRQLQKNGVDVAGAFWLLDSEKEDWALFIVLKSGDESARLSAHEEIHKAFEQLPDLWLDWSEVRLLGPADRLAQEITTARQQRRPRRLKDRYHIKLGGFRSAQVHIYPLSTT